MSRTYKTRPQWVKLNDPKFPSMQRHDHIVIHREKTGRMITKTRSKWIYAEGWGKLVQEEYEVPELRIWSEIVPCDMDKPEVSWRVEKKLRATGEEKRCDKLPLYRNGCPCCSHSYSKRLDSQTKRASINQQLHNAVRDHGWTTDPDEWYDVDINTVGVAADWDFWD